MDLHGPLGCSQAVQLRYESSFALSRQLLHGARSVGDVLAYLFKDGRELSSSSAAAWRKLVSGSRLHAVAAKQLPKCSCILRRVGVPNADSNGKDHTIRFQPDMRCF